MDVEGLSQDDPADGGQQRADARAGRDEPDRDARRIEPQAEVRGSLRWVAHVDGQLEDTQPCRDGTNQHLGFKQETLARDPERGDLGDGVAAEPTLAVEEAPLGEKLHPVVRDAVAALVGRGGAVAGHVANTEDERVPIGHRAIETDGVGRQVLPIGVERDDRVDPPALCDRQGGADGRAFAAIVGMADDDRASRARHLGGRVGRAIVDDPDLVEASEELPDERGDRFFCLKRRQDRDAHHAQRRSRGTLTRPPRGKSGATWVSWARARRGRKPRAPGGVKRYPAERHGAAEHDRWAGQGHEATRVAWPTGTAANFAHEVGQSRTSPLAR
jgi:hypothetical protein